MVLDSKKINQYLLNLGIAFDAVFVNKIRTLLTALGVIFGVAAVIAMLAIGNGAKQEVLEQMKMIGVNNIIIKAKEIELKIGNNNTEETEEDKDNKSKESLSPGLSIMEANSFRNIIPTVKYVSTESKKESNFVYKDNHYKGDLSGVNIDFFKVFQIEMEDGYIPSMTNFINGDQVCVIGHNVKSRLFPTSSAVGKQIKCGKHWYKIIGVMSIRGKAMGVGASAGIDDFDKNVYIPIQSFLKRHNDKSIVTKLKLLRNGEENIDPNRNQVDNIVVQVKDSKHLRQTAELLDKILKRKHSQAEDYTISVPEILLQQEQKTRNIFNIVLGAIASISLVVGGIGIMNIMLASVMERTKEIGIRRSIGARATDVVFQFLAEASIISLLGGFIGVILGIILAFIISKVTDIPTVVSWFSVIVSFAVSAAVGIVFGFMPAKKAADNDIVDSLRYE
jgi:putative ABC transport system permease protein